LRAEILRLHLLRRIVSAYPNLGAEPSPGATPEAVIEKRRVTLRSHEEIFAAISRHDSAAAKAAMEWHIQDGMQKIFSEHARRQLGLGAKPLTPDELAYVP